MRRWPSRGIAAVLFTEFLYFGFTIGVPVISVASIGTTAVAAIRRRRAWREAAVQILVGAVLLVLWEWTGRVGGIEGL